jgi:hypothetical protein
MRKGSDRMNKSLLFRFLSPKGWMALGIFATLMLVLIPFLT